MEEIILKYREKIIAGLAMGLVLALSFGVVSPMMVLADEGDYTLTINSTAGGSVLDSDNNVYEGEFEMDYGDSLELTADPDEENGFVFEGWEIPDEASYTFEEITAEGEEETDATINVSQDEPEEGDDYDITLTANFSSDNEVSVATRLMGWLSFQVDTSIQLHELVQSDGSVQLGHGYSAMEIGTNNNAGWAVQMRGGTECDDDAFGNCNSGRSSLLGAAADYYIGSLNERGTVSAGSDNYGALTQPLVDEDGECLVDDDEDERCDSVEDSFWESAQIPRGNPLIEENEEGTYEWAEVGYNDEGGEIDDDEARAGEIPYGSSNIIAESSLPHDTATIARFHVRAAASQMAPSDDYTDQITLTALGNIE